MTGTVQVHDPAVAAVAEVPGHAFRVVADAASTGGTFSLTEATSPPGAAVPPHIHHRAVECFYILDGQYRFTVSGRVHESGPGGFELVPRGAAHEFEVVGPDPARALVLFSPAGFESVFRAMPDIFGTAGEPGPLWEQANRAQHTDLLPPGQPHPSGPAAVTVPAGAQHLATTSQTITGLNIEHRYLARETSWRAEAPVSAAWVIDGALRIDTGASGDCVVPAGQFVTIDGASVLSPVGPRVELLVLELTQPEADQQRRPGGIHAH